MTGGGGVWVGGLFSTQIETDDATDFTESKLTGLGRYGFIGALLPDK
jgi:hypothetical protein